MLSVFRNYSSQRMQGKTSRALRWLSRLEPEPEPPGLARPPPLTTRNNTMGKASADSPRVKP
jgi:hypothetical protein